MLLLGCACPVGTLRSNPQRQWIPKGARNSWLDPSDPYLTEGEFRQGEKSQMQYLILSISHKQWIPAGMSNTSTIFVILSIPLAMNSRKGEKNHPGRDPSNPIRPADGDFQQEQEIYCKILLLLSNALNFKRAKKLLELTVPSYPSHQHDFQKSFEIPGVIPSSLIHRTNGMIHKRSMNIWYYISKYVMRWRFSVVDDKWQIHPVTHTETFVIQVKDVGCDPSNTILSSPSEF